MSHAPRHRWTPEQEALLRAQYAHTRTQDLATALALPLDVVQRKACAMGLRKAREVIAAMARERTLRPDHGSRAYRWQPGGKPWNAGVKGSAGLHPCSRQTQFKPGHKPHTWVPVGTTRIKHGTLEIKYSDDPGSPSRRWKFYGRHVWELAHGPVPKGHLVVFRPGRATTDPALVTLDAVELITRREIMARNTMHRLPEPLARTIQLRGVLTRAINQRTKALKDTA
jgi:hypothetical protein